jgi:hypothetical protein
MRIAAGIRRIAHNRLPTAPDLVERQTERQPAVGAAGDALEPGRAESAEQNRRTVAATVSATSGSITVACADGSAPSVLPG